MKPRVIKLTGTPSPIKVIAERFDDRYSNANCEADKGGAQADPDGQYSNFLFNSARAQARRAKRAAKRAACKPPLALLLLGPIGLVAMLIWKKKCQNKAAAAAAANTTACASVPTTACASVPATTGCTTAVDPNSANYQAGYNDGSQDAQDALNSRDDSDAQPDDGTGNDDGDGVNMNEDDQDGSGGDDGSVGDSSDDQSMDQGGDLQTDDSDDSGSDQGGSDGGGNDGMGQGGNDAMGQDGGDSGQPRHHRNKHKNSVAAQEDNSDDGASDDGSVGDDVASDDQQTDQGGDLLTEEDMGGFTGFSNASGRKVKPPKLSIAHTALANKMVKLHEDYLKNGTSKLLSMAKAAGVTPPSLGGDKATWDAFVKTALKKVTPFKKLVTRAAATHGIPVKKVIPRNYASLGKKMKGSSFTGQGKVMIGTSNEAPQEIQDRLMSQEMSFDGEGGEFAFSPMGYESNIEMFGSEAGSSASGPMNQKRQSGNYRQSQNNKARRMRVPKDDLNTPTLVKNGNVTVVHNALNPKIGKNRIEIPPVMTDFSGKKSSFSGDNSQTGLIGLDAISDYDEGGVDYYFLGADGVGKVKKTRLAPLLGIGLLAAGIIAAAYALKKTATEG